MIILFKKDKIVDLISKSYSDGFELPHLESGIAVVWDDKYAAYCLSGRFFNNVSIIHCLIIVSKRSKAMVE